MSAPRLNPPPQRFAHDAMACTFELLLPGCDAAYARRVARAAFDEVDRTEQLLSRFIPHSDVARINRLAAGQSVRVSLETAECLQLAAQAHTLTGGAFDIAYRSRRRLDSGGSVPSPLVLDPATHAVGVQVAGIDLDLGGIGKGYALDRVVAVLHDWGLPAALVHAGQSTVYALGTPPAHTAWHVNLRNPEQPDRTVDRVALHDAALAGSGQTLHGRHIRDPRTGQPPATVNEAWAGAPTAALADALSTAFSVMAPADIAALCARTPGVSAILRLPQGAAHTLVRYPAANAGRE